jgi:hypothetical protein
MTNTHPLTSDQVLDNLPARDIIPAENHIPEKKIRRARGGQLGNHNSLSHGAPPGNNNAIKHGFYSGAFTRLERKRLEQELQGELNDEEECIRLVVRRYIDSMGEEKMGHDRYLLAIRALCLAFGRIESIHRSRKVIYDKQTTLDQVWEELKLIPPEED